MGAVGSVAAVMAGRGGHMSSRTKRMWRELAQKVTIRNRYQKILNYIIDKRDKGLLWEAFVLEVPATAELQLSNRPDYQEFQYITHSKTHFTIMVPELRRLIDAASFDSRYRYGVKIPKSAILEYRRRTELHVFLKVWPLAMT